MAERKREMSGFDILCLEGEFRDALVDGNFDKAYQPSRDEVLLRFRSNEHGRYDVAIGLGQYITRTTRSRDNPMHPPEFSRQLREYLTGGKVLDVRQRAFDRILVFEIGKREGAYELVVESFHKGNVILVKDGEVVEPLRHTEWSSRTIRPGAEWAFPPSEIDPREVTEPVYMDALRGSDSDVIRTLASVGNLGPVWAEEVCERTGVEKERMVEDLDQETLLEITRVVMDLVETVREDPDPVLVRDEEGEPVNATPVPLEIHAGMEQEPVETLSEALDEVFGPHVQSEVGEQDDRLDEVERLEEKYQRRVDKLVEQINGFKREEARSKELGDLLYARFSDVQTVLQEIQQLYDEEGWGPIFEGEFESGPVELAKPKPENDELRLAVPDEEGNLEEIDVDIELSVQENAKALYERSKEMREKKQGARRALKQAKNKLEEVQERGEELVAELEAKQQAPDPTKRFWFENFRWTFASTGNLILAGRDAKTNEQVVKRHLEDNDRYVHANFSGAPSVVVKGDEHEVTETTLQEAAQFAVAYSSAWQDQLGESEAYWVTPPQVSKTPESGEYVPTGSFIIRGDRSYLRAPVRAAIGETRVDGHRKVMGGPVDAVEHRSERYAVIEPGRTDPGDLASILSDVFEVPVEEIQAELPPGGVRLIRSHGIDESVFSGVDA